MSESEPLAVAEFQITPEEWVAVSAERLWNMDVHRSARRKQQWIWGGMAAVGGVLFVLMDAASAGVILAVVFGVMIALVPKRYRAALEKALTRNARTGIAPGVFGPHRLEVRAEGLRDVTPSYETLWRWSTVQGVDEIAGTFVIRVGPLANLILPSSAFRDSSTLRSFADAFYARLQGEEGPPEVGDA
ncbi:MAG: YcxB family protein [Gemmatimonadota bacterium]|jgi:hypothetical protein